MKNLLNLHSNFNYELSDYKVVFQKLSLNFLYDFQYFSYD